MSLVVAGAGLQTTIQDLGRPAHQHAGIPGSGAMDTIACRAANLLVGNDEQAAVLEAALIGPTIVVERPTLIALTGADLSASIDDTPLPRWRPVHVPGGSTLRFGRAVVGCRAYIGVAGGIDVPPVFGSRSTYLRAGFGGFEGRALRAGDRLRLGAVPMRSRRIADALPVVDGRPAVARWSLSTTLRPPYSESPTVRLLDGAHLALLDTASREALFETHFRVSSSSDRMGYRLERAALSLESPTELLSEGVTFGTVQLPPGGAPIILMADRQTTGGYPRVGEVASIDLPLVAQLKPGDTLRFRRASVDDAQRLLLQYEHDWAQARAAIALAFSRGDRA
jgi:antagonist of KipI